ncbi:MAG: hypothetical protein ABI898_11425 [Sphingomonadales bacterium]
MRFAMFTLSLIAAASAATAQDGPRRPMLSDACRAEVEKTCPVAADGDRRARMQCVMTSQDKFSDGCKKEFADMRERMAKMRAERGGDAPPPPPPSDGDAPPPPPQ